MILEQDTEYTTYCPYDGSKFGDVYFLYEFGPFCCNSCSALGFKKNVFLRPHIYSIFSARQNCYLSRKCSERSFCLKNGDLWTKVEEQKMEFFIGLKSKIDGRTFFGFFWFSMAQTIKNNLLDLQNCEIWPLVRLKQPK